MPDPFNIGMSEARPVRGLAALMQTWPARAAQSGLAALMAPGDVYAGNFSRAPQSPGSWSDEDESAQQIASRQMRERAVDLAGLVMGGTYAGAPTSGAVLGTGPPRSRSDVVRAANRLEGLFRDAGVSFHKDKSRISPSTYYYLDGPGDEPLKIRISQHKDKYGADFSVDPTSNNFNDLLAFLRDRGVSVADRVNGNATRINNAKKKLADEFNYMADFGRPRDPVWEKIEKISDAATLKAAQSALADFRVNTDAAFKAATGLDRTGMLMHDSYLYDLATGKISRAEFDKAITRLSEPGKASALADLMSSGGAQAATQK